MQEMFADFKSQLSPAEAVIRAIYHDCIQGMLPDLICGAEYWVQVNDPGLLAHLGMLHCWLAVSLQS